jgi:hypothetical protein
MPRGPVPLQAHQTIEPFAALLLIAAPWIFGFSDNDTATTLSVIAGVLVLATGMSTRWRMSLVKLIPLRTHFMMDVGLGIALIVAPFVAGFSDHGGATRFFVIAARARHRAHDALGRARGSPAQREKPRHRDALSARSDNRAPRRRGAVGNYGTGPASHRCSARPKASFQSSA